MQTLTVTVSCFLGTNGKAPALVTDMKGFCATKPRLKMVVQASSAAQAFACWSRTVPLDLDGVEVVKPVSDAYMIRSLV